MFTEKYNRIKQLEQEIAALTTEHQALMQKQVTLSENSFAKRAEIAQIKNEIALALKKINTNVLLDMPEGPVMLTYVPGKMGQQMVFFNAGKTEEEAKRLLMLAKMEPEQ